MTASRRFFCDTAMGQVHGVEAGSGAGAPLVLLHQTPRSVDEFKEALPFLAKHRRTIALDNPGYGGSDPVEGQPTVADYARGVVDVSTRSTSTGRSSWPSDPVRSKPIRDAFKPATEVFLDTGVFVANENPALFAQTVLDYVG